MCICFRSNCFLIRRHVIKIATKLPAFIPPVNNAIVTTTCHYHWPNINCRRVTRRCHVWRTRVSWCSSCPIYSFLCSVLQIIVYLFCLILLLAIALPFFKLFFLSIQWRTGVLDITRNKYIEHLIAKYAY